ncbi:guanine nucleotide-binding protein G(i) subunit alpha-3-like [Discoglossus pictus]
MGCVPSAEERAATARSKKIDREICRTRRLNQKVKKLLLLGATDSGKCSIVTYLQIMMCCTQSEETKRQYRVDMYRRIIDIIADIISNMERLGIDFGDMARAEDAKQLLELASSVEGGVLSDKLAGIIQRLWKDVGVQDCFRRFPHYNSIFTTMFYLNNPDMLFGTVPTSYDMCWAKNKRRSMVMARFTFKNKYFFMTDVRQHMFRRICTCFYNVLDGIIFCVGLSDYDQLDNNKNRMEESMHLFKSICNNKWFTNVPIVLFFTKKDLFMEKISRIPLTTCFPEYSGSNTYDEAAAYIQAQFQNIYQTREIKHSKELCTQFICTKDTQSIQSAFSVAVDIINKYKERD